MKNIKVKIILICILFSNVSVGQKKVMHVQKTVTNFVVELPGLLIMYVGLDNPINIGYCGDGSTILKITNGTIEDDGKGNYLARVTKVGLATLSLFQKSGTSEKLVGEKLIRVRPFPNVIGSVAGITGGSINKSTLLESPFIKPIYENCNLEFKIANISSYVVTYNLNGVFGSISVVGNGKFTKEVIDVITKLPNNSRLIIEDIKMRCPDDGCPNMLPSITLKITT